jgi:hypothetical protein
MDYGFTNPADVANETLTETEYEDRPVAVPCTIHLRSGAAFIVKDVGAWQYTDEGIFATGQWLSTFQHVTNCGVGPEKDILFPLTSIDHIELDFAALAEFQTTPNDDD